MKEIVWSVYFDGDILDYIGKIEKLLTNIGFTVKSKCLHKFSDDAYTIVWILGESHFIIHTYPEYETAYFNLFSCKSCHSSSFLDMVARDITKILGYDTVIKSIRVIKR